MPLPLSFRWPDELVAAIDEARGDVPRTVFVKRAVEAALGRPDEGPRAQPPRGSGSPGTTASTPPRASAKSAPVNYAMEHQQKLNDAKYGTKS